MPGAEGRGEGSPFTAVLADIDDGVKKTAVIDFYVSPLYREKPQNLFSLFLCYFHVPSILFFPCVNRP
jgi:predicted membrane-bound mannosyltransferase